MYIYISHLHYLFILYIILFKYYSYLIIIFSIISAYKVIEFIDGIQLMPINWLSHDFKLSYWPPSYLNQIKVNKLIANRPDSDTDNWSTYSVKHIFCSTVIIFIQFFILNNIKAKMY